MITPLRVLFIEDSENDARLQVRMLSKGGYEVTYQRVDTPGGLEKALSEPWDLIISDFSMPGFTGMKALEMVRNAGRDVPFVFVSGTIGEDAAVAALKEGAQDYVMKTNLKRLLPAVDRSLREKEDERQRRRMQLQISQLQRFESIGRLAGGIAHDFNNVLAGVMGWAEIGYQEAYPDQRLQDRFEKIRIQAERAAGLTRQLLAFARRQVLDQRVINLNSTVSELLTLMNTALGAQIELKLALSPDILLTRADPSQIEQVIMNLCLNARDAMPRGGRLLVGTRSVEVDDAFCRQFEYARSGSHVLLSIADTGVGMDPGTLEHIFEPFFTTKEVGKGTGLGLATVYGIIKQHGGFIHVESAKGCGSSFQVYLPKAEGVLTPEKKQRTIPARGGTETILVVEDNEANLEISAQYLRGLGYTVLTACDGEAGLRMFESNRERIAMAMIDVVLPKLTGSDLYSKMRQLGPAVPVLFISGYSVEHRNSTTWQDGAAEVLQKPYSLAVCAAKVRELLDRQGQPIT